MADISIPTDIDRLFDQINSDGIVLDVLINNAAVIELWDITEKVFSSEEIFKKINTNLSGAIAVTQRYIIQANQANSNVIINITAGTAVFPVPIFALYSASKTGLSVFTKLLRQQLKNKSFKIIEIMPPNVATEMPQKVGNTDLLPNSESC